ncbi:protein disulfide-isomerase A6 homolog isoform X1 [Octopus bimaculoides]|uniref:protein disulfide-isomerase n=2 Tax=Octopus bimaculoides TaxID=37653 RepID=A0A0L8GJH1_OCTBM|nr:protein disulfide-isomerase A6 homolog isoform X1 [Octopus bimaculoides]|eukprot:XP_014780796.1 PREDICTED: probable protein disulfide-isomerase A6 [Octopus bimaculoides]
MEALPLSCFLLLFFGAAVYSNPIELTPDNFQSKVVNSDSLWIVMFYAPWCGHCQSFKPEFAKAAEILKGIVKLGQLDADAHRGMAGEYGIQGFPTIKVFGQHKSKPEDYQGGRTANSVVEAAKKYLSNMISQRTRGGGGGSSSGGGSSGGHKTGSADDVIELTDSNFEEMVLKSDDMWLVEFFAPWCGHCKNLAPQWQSAATELKGKVKLGALDATVHTLTSEKYGIRGFPTIKFFPAGVKDGSAQEYDGGRTSSDIVAWSLEKVAENVPAPPVNEVITASVLKDACEKSQLCVISILPVIYDCQSECRNNFISIVEKMSEKYKRNLWGWVWAEAGSQPQLEEAFGIGGFGYPAMVALNYRSMKYSPLKGSFSASGLNEFFRDLLYGKSSTVPLRNAKLPEILNIDAWDGQDKELPQEEDIDLSDVELDDLDSKPKSEL